MDMVPDPYPLVQTGQNRKNYQNPQRLIGEGVDFAAPRLQLGAAGRLVGEGIVEFVFYLSIRSNHSDVVELVRSTMSCGLTSILMR